MQLAELTAGELKALLTSGQTTCADVMRSVLAEIDRREPTVQAFLHLRDRQALVAEAQAIDDRRRRGDPIGVLAGLPIAIKDNICTKTMPTTCASRILAGFVPPYDATVVRRLHAADAIIIGKTNLDEFAMGSSTENSAVHVTRNPHDLARVPGGTSGGSAAAVAAYETILAVGSDTGGSLRQPASFCGVVACKPTYGRVSRYGLVAHGSSLDQIGPIAKSVHDAALLLTVLGGHDPLDSTSLTAAFPRLDDEPSRQPLRVGVPEEYFGPGLDAEVRGCVQKAVALLQEAGDTIVPVHLPHTRFAISTYYVIACAEASSNLARYDGCRYGFRTKEYANLIEMMGRTRTQGFGDEVIRRIILGTYVLSAGYYDAYYTQAAKVRRLISRDFETAFASCDVIAHPVAPAVAFKIGEKNQDPLAMYLGDIYTVIANLTGLPAMSIPCGWNGEGLPVGMQLVAKWLNEPTLFQAAFHAEALLASAGIWNRRPKTQGNPS